MEKVIAVAIDDILNNFSQMLNNAGIIFDNRIHSMSDPKLKQCLYDYNSGGITAAADMAMGSAGAVHGCSEALHALISVGWTVVLCTQRDLRFAYSVTVKWLRDNDMTYSYLVQTDDYTDLCRRAGIDILVSCRRAGQCGNIKLFHSLKDVMQCFQN